jgi:flagellar protein FliO/FliZ
LEPLDLIRATAALALTLGLLLGLAWLARRFGLMQGAAMPASRGRLKLVEQLWLDAGRSRLVIVRCDATEHVLVLTPTSAQTITSMPAASLSVTASAETRL